MYFVSTLGCFGFPINLFFFTCASFLTGGNYVESVSRVVA